MKHQKLKNLQWEIWGLHSFNTNKLYICSSNKLITFIKVRYKYGSVGDHFKNICPIFSFSLEFRQWHFQKKRKAEKLKCTTFLSPSCSIALPLQWLPTFFCFSASKLFDNYSRWVFLYTRLIGSPGQTMATRFLLADEYTKLSINEFALLAPGN